MLIVKTVEFNGKCQSLKAWAEELGITYQSLWNRLKSGMRIEDALTRGKHVHAGSVLPASMLTFDGTTQPISEWALDYGIPARLICKRIKQGWTIERAITRPMRTVKGQRLPEAPGVVDNLHDDAGDRCGVASAGLGANRVFSK